MNKAIPFISCEKMNHLRCPISGGKLIYDSVRHSLYSEDANLFFPIKNGIPILLAEEAVSNMEEKASG